MHRLLVLGGSGWVGRGVLPVLAKSYDVIAPSRADLDVMNYDALVSAFEQLRPRIVLNLAAKNPPATAGEMQMVNATAPGIVAAACAMTGARFVHMSTDLVLDGKRAPYADNAPASPLNDYGRSKAIGERTVLTGAPGALVLRTSLVVDETTPDRFTQTCMEKLARGEQVTLFSDEIRCPITRTALGVALADILGREGSGILNVAGAEPVSRHTLGLLLLTHFGARDLWNVRAALAASHPEPRPLDLTLDVSRAQSMLRTPLPRITDSLR